MKADFLSSVLHGIHTRIMCSCVQVLDHPNRLSLGYGDTVTGAGFVGISELNVFPY